MNPDSEPHEHEMLQQEDVRAIRQAVDNPRDRALVDLMLYAGLRSSEVLAVQMKNLDLEDGTLRLSGQDIGLKGGAREAPLLYAQEAVKKWYSLHPQPGTPESYFITRRSNPEWLDDVSDRLYTSSVNRIVERIAQRSDTDKQVIPFQFRHVSVGARRQAYQRDIETIESLIGSEVHSQILNQMYNQLSVADAIGGPTPANQASDGEEPRCLLTPNVCDVCGESIQREDARVCPVCRTRFVLPAENIARLVRGHVSERYGPVDLKEVPPRDGIEILDDVIQDPNVTWALLAHLESK